MDGLRNPFAIRDGNVILIEDLTASERGLKCRCRCPACDGDFIARMGVVKAHHFAHSKDACDEVLAYTSGLYRLIHQMLGSGNPFYLPALAVSYTLPDGSIINESNVCSFVNIVSEHSAIEMKEVISPGRFISFESAEIVYDSKNHLQRMGIKSLLIKKMKAASMLISAGRLPT